MKPDSALSRIVIGRADLNPLWLRTWLRLLQTAAWFWRRMMYRTTFVAITGSAGKTTAKNCLGAILGSAAPTVETFGTRNDYAHGIPSTILRIHPWIRFAVFEVGAHRRNVMHRSSRLLRPQIAIITTINRSHPEEYQSSLEVAVEKAKLIDGLPPGGIAILNGDNQHLARIAANRRGRLLTFGCEPGNDLRATRIESSWPGRLGFQAHYKAETIPVQTQFVGAQYMGSVLAALAGAIACGVSLSRAAHAIAEVEPYLARTQPVLLPSGATMLRDDFGGNWYQFQAALDVLAQASAGRRIAVLGPVSDAGAGGRQNWRDLGTRAAAVADVAVFVGSDAGAARPAALAAGLPPDRVFCFQKLKPAAEFLTSELGPGDLVLLKGGRATEHITRLFFAQTGSVDCWVRKCQKPILCDFCDEMGYRPDERLAD